MPRDKSNEQSNTTLRERAEKRLSERSQKEWPPDDILKLVHELEVHQVELEMQNEELRRAQLATERAEERYADFYDFAPVGYLTLDEKGLISDSNLAASGLLDVERKFLIHKPFHRFIKAESQDAFSFHRQEVLASSTKQTCELVIKKNDGTFFNAELCSIGVEIEGQRLIRIVLTDITERKRAEEKVQRLLTTFQEERNRLSALVSSIQDEVWFADTEKRFTLANPAALWEFGLEGSNETDIMKFAESLEVYRPDGSPRPVDEAPALRALKGEMVSNQEEKIRTPRSEQLRWREVNAAPVKDTAGAIIGSVAIVRDITERKRAEEALKETDILLHAVVDNTSDPIYIKDKQGRIVMCNPALEKVVGKPAAEIIGKTDSEYYGDPDIGQALRENDLRVMESGRNQTMEETVKTPDGLRTFLSNKAPYRNASGILIGTIGISHDITELKQSEAALRESEARLAQALRIADIGIWERNLQSGELTWCDRMYRMFGEERGPFMPRYESFVNRLHPDDRQKVIDTIQDAVARRCSYELEFRVITDTAGTLTILAHGEVNVNSSGEPERITGTALDLTARKQIEEDLRKARDELELRVEERTAQLSQAYERLQHEMEAHKKTEEELRQSQKMEAVGTLAGGIAHDFNNILAAIIGFAEMGLEDIPPGSSLEKSFQYILTSSFRARDLVRQILAFSRKAGYERSPFPLTPIVKETAKFLRASIPASTEIIVQTTTQSDTVLASPTEIQQIIMNLGTNAAHAMQDTGGRLGITLSDADTLPGVIGDPEFAPADYLQITVTDTGVGMDAEVKKRIFEPFFTTKEVGKGTGMGLSVVYGIVKSLNGEISVESEPQLGSIFRIFLPKIEAETQSEALKTEEAPRGKERILFIDDEELLAEWGQAALERLGYTATAMTDSAEALKLFSEDPSRFNLVITDHAMPNMTGVQLSKNVLKIRPDIPVILCTGHSDNVSPDSSRAIGVREFLTKPVSKQKLAEAVRRVLDGKDWRVK